MKITLTILKYYLFCTLLLAFGQVPVGRTTLGAQYLMLLKQGWDKGSEQVMATKTYATVADWPFFNLFLKAPIKEASRPPHPITSEVGSGTRQARLKLPTTQKIAGVREPDVKSDIDVEPHDEITASDRESLIRLLK